MVYVTARHGFCIYLRFQLLVLCYLVSALPLQDGRNRTSEPPAPAAGPQSGTTVRALYLFSTASSWKRMALRPSSSSFHDTDASNDPLNPRRQTTSPTSVPPREMNSTVPTLSDQPCGLFGCGKDVVTVLVIVAIVIIFVVCLGCWHYFLCCSGFHRKYGGTCASRRDKLPVAV